LIDVFLEDAPRCIQRITGALENRPELSFQARSLRGLCQNLGAARVIEVSHKIEEAGRNGQIREAAALLQDLQLAYAQTRDQLLAARSP